MGTPDNLEAFVRWEADDLTIYVSRQLLATLKPGAKEMIFYMDGYGRFVLQFEQPWEPESET
ncbi:MAG: hypothetical protein RML46_11475 [Anaerolineae bacterium]|nr:hypothetical protein [Anaerolineae bacterium]MDW8069523.1 hypothetical protein [Anaerolineae bacterium]